MRLRKEASPAAPMLRRPASSQETRRNTDWMTRHKLFRTGAVLLVVGVAMAWVRAGWAATLPSDQPSSKSLRTETAGSSHTPPTTITAPNFNNNNNNNNSHKPAVRWPLEALEGDYPTAGEFYRRGFFQFLPPVPLERWPAVDNTTCVYPGTNNNASAYEASLEDWQKRIPFAVLLGTQKGGTTALAYYLYNHPSVQYLPQKELDFFDQELDRDPAASGGDPLRGGTHALSTLLRFQASSVGSLLPLQKFRDEPGIGVLDATPQYLFLSDRVPGRLLCAAPWAKLLCLLRNPVDRAFSQYLMQAKRDRKHPATRRGFLTFEEYVDPDLAVLEETGVLPALKAGDGAATAKAWSVYTKLGVNAPIGRGLYHLQLSQWIAAMEEAGKPRSDLWVVPSEKLFEDPRAVHEEALAFLGLDPKPLEQYAKIHAGDYGPGGLLRIDPATRSRLEAFFRPHNAKLAALLGDEWEGIWDGPP